MSTEDLLALDDDGIEALMNQELSATLDAPDDFEEHARLGALDHGAYTAAVIDGAAGMTISVEPEVFQDYSLAEQHETQRVAKQNGTRMQFSPLNARQKEMMGEAFDENQKLTMSRIAELTEKVHCGIRQVLYAFEKLRVENGTSQTYNSPMTPAQKEKIAERLAEQQGRPMTALMYKEAAETIGVGEKTLQGEFTKLRVENGTSQTYNSPMTPAQKEKIAERFAEQQGRRMTALMCKEAAETIGVGERTLQREFTKLRAENSTYQKRASPQLPAEKEKIAENGTKKTIKKKVKKTIKKKKVKKATMNDRMLALGCSGIANLRLLAFDETGTSAGSKGDMVERLELARSTATV